MGSNQREGDAVEAASLASVVARYRAHNDRIAQSHGLQSSGIADPVVANLREARYYLARSVQVPAPSARVASLQTAVARLMDAVEALRAARAA